MRPPESNRETHRLELFPHNIFRPSTLASTYSATKEQYCMIGIAPMLLTQPFENSFSKVNEIIIAYTTLRTQETQFVCFYILCSPMAMSCQLTNKLFPIGRECTNIFIGFYRCKPSGVIETPLIRSSY